MDALKGNIFGILNGDKQFLLPVYQRYYSWENEQCERLWNDLVNIQKTGKPYHFVGSIVNIAEQSMPTGVQKYMVIDGQQRMTTITLLLLALRDYVAKRPEVSSLKASKINTKLLINDEVNKDDKYKLLLTENDRDILIGLVEQKPIPDGTKSRLLDAYSFFEKKIASLELPPEEVYESIGKLQIVNITLERTVDDAQAIFESLNSTGKDLSESDLIRNYVLMGLPPKEQDYVYEHLWRPMEKLFSYETQDSVMDKFFRDYLTMKLARIPKRDHIYEEFKLYHLNCEFGTTRELCQDLFDYAYFYADMASCRSKDNGLMALYKEMNELRMEVSYPFLLKAHKDCAASIITTDELKEIIRLCISYVFRRSICEVPPNSLNKTFATLKNEIKSDDYMNSFKAFFVKRDDYKIFPDDESFAAAFVSKDVYSLRARNYILGCLENYKSKAPIVIENYTIEHILPQNPQLCQEWRMTLGANWAEVQKRLLHTIGNLTLTAYNSEMSDRPFMDKLEMSGGFKESALKLNAYVVKQTEWNEQTIKERARLLAEQAKQIWPYPDIDMEKLALYLEKKKASAEYSLNTYDTNDTTKSLFEVLDRRIQNLSPDVKREFKKLYVAYKLDTNFVDVLFQKKRLRLSLNMKFSEINDPEGFCRDVTGLGRWGNGDVELFMEHVTDIDKVMGYIKQSYMLQAEE